MVTISIDHRHAAATIDRAKRHLRAVRETLDPGGVAEITIATQHGREAAASLARRGHDPLDVPAQELTTVHDQLRRDIAKAVEMAARAGRAQDARVRVALMTGARAAVAVIRQRIIQGRLGTNAAGYAAAKAAYQKKHGPSRYGVPSAYGIKTGQMLAAFVARWRGR